VRWWHTIKGGLDRVLEWAVALLMAVLLVDVVWQVLTRFVLRDPSGWTEELARFLLIWVGLLGACVALNRNAHLGIDYVVAKLPPAARRTLAMLSCALVALFSISVLILGGSLLVVRILQLQQVSPALGWPMGYVYLALPISGFFLTVSSLSALLERVRRPNDASEHASEEGPA
jgi:TRAP-type C4-dicarboxylate transport system permease small subunit